MTFTISFAKESDAIELIDLAKQFPLKSRLVSSESTEICHLNDPHWCILIARDSELNLAGYAVGCEWNAYLKKINPNNNDHNNNNKRIAKLEDLHVFSERKGIGSLLVKRFEEWAYKVGCEVCEISGGPAPGFYEKLNYMRQGPFYHYSKIL